jgi:hypothetical protein
MNKPDTFIHKIDKIYRENYESIKKQERDKILNKLKEKLENIQKARIWTNSLSYPYPEAHAIWIGKEEIIKELINEYPDKKQVNIIKNPICNFSKQASNRLCLKHAENIDNILTSIFNA